MKEYIQYDLHDPLKVARTALDRFISSSRHWPISNHCNNRAWDATTEDKWVCATLLGAAPVSVPRTLAVIDRGIRAYPGTHKIQSPNELQAFAKTTGSSGFFAKPIWGLGGFGAFRCDGADSTHLEIAGLGPLEHQEVFDTVIGKFPYILQPIYRNHPDIAHLTPNLATVRVVVLVYDDLLKIPFALLKLPSATNVVDNFWKPGNVLCDVDLTSGALRTLRGHDEFGAVDLSVHPETGKEIIGMTLPFWSEVIATVQNASLVFPHARYQSMDIAITPDGPLLVEVNPGGAFDLPQYASKRGFLTDDVLHFLEACGFSLDPERS